MSWGILLFELSALVLALKRLLIALAVITLLLLAFGGELLVFLSPGEGCSQKEVSPMLVKQILDF